MESGNSACSLPKIVRRAPAVGLIVFLSLGQAIRGDEVPDPLLKEWRQWSIPHREVRKTPRPSDAEFLKLLPPQREEPEFDETSREHGMAIWWGDYSVQIFSRQPPTQEELTRRPVVQTIAGEDEPLVLGLWGIRDVGLVTLTVKDSPFPITIRRVEFSPRKIPTDNFGETVEGARVIGLATFLPAEDTCDVLQGRNTVYWLTVETPGDAKAGSYACALQLAMHGSREKEKRQTIELPFTVEVLDYTLPVADIAYGMYFRPTSGQNLPAHYRTPEMLRVFWRDMARHGMTSATVYSDREQTIYDDEGNVTFDGNPDMEMLEAMMEEGLVHQGIPVMWLWPHLTADAAPVVVAEARKRGFPELLYYGVDEPPVEGERAKKAKEGLESIQPWRDYFRIVTALSDRPAEVYADYLDIWAVSTGRITPELSDLAARKGAEMWTYACSDRGTGNSPMARFGAGLYTWALNLKGNFIWCYTEHYGWKDRRNAFFCRVLPSPEGPIPSIQWEARREGVEDYRSLRLLESLIAERPDHAKATEARSWLDSIRERVDWYRGRNMPPSLWAWDGIELYPFCSDFQPSELSSVRARTAAYILDLGS